jgi:DNA-binding MarR family transcriptional regulator
MGKRARPDDSRRATDEAFDTADRLHSAAIHLLRRVRREDDSTGLPAPQTSALSVIVFRGPLTLSQLAEAEQVRAPSITRVVAALEEAGLVARERPDNDRRVSCVVATARGRETLEKARSRRIAVIAREIAELPGDDRERLRAAIGVLEKLVGPRHSPASESV